MRYPNIAAERARRKMSLESFAAALGVSRKTVYNWEQAGNIPQAALLKMSDLFGCSIDYLLNREQENKTLEKRCEPQAERS